MGEERNLAFADYVGVVRHNKWILLVAVLATTASAVFFSSRQTPEYRAAATVLLNPDASLVNTAGRAAADAQARFDTGQALIAHTPPVAARALLSPGAPKVTPLELLSMSSVTSDPNSNVLTFAVTSPKPALASQLVNAYVDGYASYSAKQLTARIQLAIAEETQQIDSLSRRIAARRQRNESAGTLYPELHGLLDQRTVNQQTLNALSATGGAQVVRHADGASQTQPQTTRNAAIGLALGLILGIAIAFLRRALDTRVRSAAEIEKELDIPLLARIPAPPKRLAANYKLAMLSDSDKRHREPHRTLRVAIDNANSRVNAKIMMVTSAIEQEGKSTTVANLAVAMARAGRNTVLVDLDLRKPALARFFDLGDRPGMTDVALGHSTLEQALVPIPLPDDGAPRSARSVNGNGNGNGAGMLDGVLRVVPVGRLRPDPVDFLSSKRIAYLLAQIAEDADIVLIDSAPLLPVADSVSLSNHIDAIIVIAKAVSLRRSMLHEERRLLSTCHGVKLGFVLAGAESEDGYGYGYGYGETGYASREQAAGLHQSVAQTPTSA